MTDPRELLARLNPPNVKFDVGRGGGVPELTAQDIAAALAFVPPGLGRELLINLWWEGGGNDDRLHAAAKQFVFDEFLKRGREHIDAQGALVLAEICSQWAGGSDEDLLREVQRCRTRLKEAKDRCWPKDLLQMLPVFIEMVCTEIVRERCETCSGRGKVLDGALLTICPSCEGSGVIGGSGRSRADAMGCPESTYRVKWRDPYLWLHDGMVEAERTAVRHFRNALGKVP
jgi:hypothetical protein